MKYKSSTNKAGTSFVSNLLRAALSAAIVGWSWAPAAASAQEKPYKLVVPYTPAGATDLTTRIASQYLAKELNATVMVENKPGANTIIATQYVATSPPDGYTLLVAGTASMTSNSFLYRKLPYDAEKAFVPIGMLSRMPFVIIVNSNSTVKSVADLISKAKSAKAPLNYGSAGNGNPTHLAGVLFSEIAGVPLQHIPYQGSSPSIAALLGGQTDLNFEVLSTALPYIRAGKLRAIAVMSLVRSSKLPDTPTLAELGLQGLDITTSFALLAPAGTALPMQQRLHKALMAATSKAGYIKALDDQALEAYPTMTQEETLEIFAKERVRWRTVIQKNSISLD